MMNYKMSSELSTISYGIKIRLDEVELFILNNKKILVDLRRDEQLNNIF